MKISSIAFSRNDAANVKHYKISDTTQWNLWSF